MNAIALLKADHRSVEELFDKLDKLTGKSTRNKKTLVEQIIRELSIHAAIEEQVFYPAVRKLPGEEEQILESLEEHSVLKWELAAIQSLDADDERLDAKLKVLRDAFLHHIDEEENDMFPRVRRAMNVARLNELGNQLEKARKLAPTRPHPRAPVQPPANIVAGLGAGVIDRMRDVGRAAARSRGKKAEQPARAPSRGRATRAARATTGAGRGTAATRASKAPAKRGRPATRNARSRRAHAG